jgi:hypothetical protein
MRREVSMSDPTGTGADDATPDPGPPSPVDGAPTEPTTSEPVDPGADPSGPAVPVSVWAQPDPTAAPRRPLSRRPAVIVIAWLAALALMAVAAQAVSQTNATTSYEMGYAVGTVVGPLALALLAAIVLGVIRERRVSASTFTTAWIPIVASGILLVRAFGAAAAIPPEVDPATALRVGPGYALAAADPATESQLKALVAAEREARSSAVRLVQGDDGSSGVLLVVDFALRPDMSTDEFRDGVAAGLKRSMTSEVIDGTEVHFFENDGVYGAVWPEPPHALYAFAADEAGIHALVTSILEAR